MRKVSQAFQVLVVEISEDKTEFTGRLHDTTEPKNPEEIATFKLTEVDSADRGKIVEGAVFQWLMASTSEFRFNELHYTSDDIAYAMTAAEKYRDILVGEDPRKTGLKNGLRQLTAPQLQRVIDYPGEMVLDNLNYSLGCFCPLAIGVGLDLIMAEPSHEKVFDVLSAMGFKVYNTKGIAGSFYLEDRKRDLLIAAREVLEEKI